MSSAEQHLEALDLIVRADGSGVVDAAQLARWGVKPGTHLSVVPVTPAASTARRRSLRGALANASGSAPSWEDFEAASSAVARESAERYGDGGAWDLPRR
ncbi:hypothetical protein [Geodermatophilus chilensis]|jgi:hypothetical protein|uniref:hypothetical protein n=1 Tax=Geodermatophilus chilensis TaxID=2035835 RepID=UPI0012FFDA94|nr:hypothetical protein [Geodermatophilus chilensis]